jgi:transposase
VDDFALRRGHRYGTILVDLERRRVVDLLPDRSAMTLARWLESHGRGVEVVSRDRFQPYIDGIDMAVPEATQVADRWHLTKNLAETVEKVLDRNRKALREATERMLPPPAKIPWPWVAFLRWCWNHGRLHPDGAWDDVYTYCEKAVSRQDFEEVVRRLRDGQPLHPPRSLRKLAKEEAKRRNPKAVTRLFLRKPVKLAAEDRQYLQELKEVCPEAEEAYRLALDFVGMVRKRKPEELRFWLAVASASGLRTFRDFSESLRKDEAAVRAALELPWSNGQVEGQINRLKLLKRQTYGRAGFDLLKRRARRAA